MPVATACLCRAGPGALTQQRRTGGPCLRVARASGGGAVAHAAAARPAKALAGQATGATRALCCGLIATSPRVSRGPVPEGGINDAAGVVKDPLSLRRVGDAPCVHLTPEDARHLGVRVRGGLVVEPGASLGGRPRPRALA
eukprot:CAMPEP_0171226542 /NCGR_PEP_ID=MMETSP0790-20130122/37385_1 /TAXON_ID=2925 /ORGANISM="Alexandrium catenella, Strain OF101" /LENGTH=140 /DNA_ID=CAMNT_0011692627 /DNA_START=24 /DNA_END=443 /DNA_ORIENTATION=-